MDHGTSLRYAAAKAAILLFVVVAVISVTIAFAVWHHDDFDSRVQFRLIDETAESFTQDDLAGSYALVFFGFTHCRGVCPTQMSKLTQVMAVLDDTGHSIGVRPVFISVDPERDTPEKVAKYLDNFDDRFIGLTGSRSALKSAANSFETLLEEMSAENSGDDYQIPHSSVTYIVDPSGRIIDYVPGTLGAEAIADKVREII